MIATSDHGHSGGQIPDHVMCSLSHPVLVVVESKVLLDELLARRHGDLDGAVDHGRCNVLNRLFDCNLDELCKLWLLLHQIKPWVNDDMRHDSVQVACVDVGVVELRLWRTQKASCNKNTSFIPRVVSTH